MAEIWFSSDLHLHHANIITYCNRPFKDVAEMNQVLLERHNAYVKPQDHWYNLGDVTMMRDSKGYGLELIKKFNGHKRLIMGNHDHYHAKVYLRFFEKVMAMQMFDNIRFTHIPIHPGSMGRATANIHGHTHEAPNYSPVVVELEDKTLVKPYINISVERTDYRPVNLEEIKSMVKERIEEWQRS